MHNEDISRDELLSICPIDFSVFDEQTRKEMFAVAYLKAKNELKMTEEEAKNYAISYVRRECMREQLFRDAPKQNISIKLLFMVPVLFFIVLIGLGILFKTKWLFYAPALLLMFIWVLMRWRSGFWTPLLYWFAGDRNRDLTYWQEFFLTKEVNIKMLINAVYDFAQPSPTGVIIRGFVIHHLLFWAIFCILAYFAWR